jgi:hypothetical protein
MAATTTDWVALAKSLWRAAQVTGCGEHAVVVRCHLPADVFLFETYSAARAFQAGRCCSTCAGKHTYGSLVPHIPAPPPRKIYRWNAERQRD